MFGFLRSKRQPRIQHPLKFQHYQYMLGYRFDPGAQAEVFEPGTSNPVFAIRGAGKIAGQFRVTQHPQVWFTPQVTVASVGSGGTIAGQLIGQPLLDPSQLEG